MEKGYQLQQWTFVERLGGGGMAEVWKARHKHLDQFAAIKFLLPGFAENTEAQDRFLREGASQFKLRHPNIVRSSDYITQDNRHFLVMEYIEGRSLYTLAMDKGPLDAASVVRLALPLLDALSHAHEKGIVHRDVKLQNILLDENDKPYLTDFGIAKALRPQGGSSERGKTGTSMLLGTMECMSPEQIQHPADIDARSDIYSFGCVLYDLLTGQPPFLPDPEDPSDFEIMRKHVFERPRPLRELNPDIPEAIEAVVLRALEKDRNQRFASCKEMARALEALPESQAKAVTATETVKGEIIEKPDDPDDDDQPPSPPPPSSKRTSIIVSLMVAVLLGLVIFIVVQEPSPAPPGSSHITPPPDDNPLPPPPPPRPEIAYTDYEEQSRAYKTTVPRNWKVDRYEGWSPDKSVYRLTMLFSPEGAERAEVNGWVSEGMRIAVILPQKDRFFLDPVAFAKLLMDSALKSYTTTTNSTTGDIMLQDFRAAQQNG